MKAHRWIYGVAAGCMSIGVAMAEPQRTALTQENRLPDRRELEVELWGGFHEYSPAEETFFVEDDLSVWTVEPRLRYGVNRDFALRAAVPVVSSERGEADAEYGLGDVRVGFSLRAFEQPYDVPYVIPYADLSLPTGDDEKDHGFGEVAGIVGLAVGTMVWEDVYFGLDVAGILKSGDGIVRIGGHIVWALSRKFSVIAEVQAHSEELYENRNKVFALGGMAYRPADLWQVAVHGGTSIDGDAADSIAAVKITRTFDDHF